jgi:hypothetical protein
VFGHSNHCIEERRGELFAAGAVLIGSLEEEGRMKSRIFVCCLQAAIALSVASGQKIETVKYRYPWGVDRVSFDATRTARADLDRWMRLSPYLSPYNDLLVSVSIIQCLPGDKRYIDCKIDGSIKLKIPNIDENIRRIEDIKHGLTVEKVPDGLKPIVAYFLEIQSFSLWRTRQQRAFFLTNDVSVLRDQYDGLASNQRCDAILHKMEHPEKEMNITNLVVADWSNCVWALESEKIGPYPKKEWDAFLASRGIKEDVKEEVPDD